MLKYKVAYQDKESVIPSNSDQTGKDSIESDIKSIFANGGTVKAILSDKLDEIKSLYLDRIRDGCLVNPLSEGMISLESI